MLYAVWEGDNTQTQKESLDNAGALSPAKMRTTVTLFVGTKLLRKQQEAPSVLSNITC